MHSSAANQANAQNAQHSTGPKTPEGKARASANARTHGLCAKDVIVANPEEQIEFDELLSLHLAEIRDLRCIRGLEIALNQGIWLAGPRPPLKVSAANHRLMACLPLPASFQKKARPAPDAPPRFELRRTPPSAGTPSPQPRKTPATDPRTSPALPQSDA